MWNPAPHLRLIGLAAVASLAVAASATIAVEAWSAARRHRLAAERALRDHAGSAALGFRERVIARLYYAVDVILRPVDPVDPAWSDDSLPPPVALQRAAELAGRCPQCGRPLHPTLSFRLTLADSSLDLEGQPLSPVRRGELTARLAALAASSPPRWYTSFIDTLAPAPEMIYLTVLHGPGERPRAVYGFAVALSSLVETMLRPVLDDLVLLPLAVPGNLSNDSLLSVTLVEPQGSRALELSPRRHPDAYAASIHGSRFLGGWRIRVALDPRSAPDLLVGGLPPVRALPLAAMVLVTVVLIAATVLAAWRALELARLRADFLASVSHELRTPLAQILLFGESLTLGRMQSRRDVRAAGGVIVGEARRLLQLVENVAVFGRRGRPAPAAPFSPEPLAPLVREVVDSFAPIAAASAARVRTTRLDEVIAPVDRGAIRRILLNLMDNAAKYGPRDQTVSVGLALVGDRARLWVEDEGPGIPRADRERVWQPFVRLPRDLDGHAAGSGIGLALVRELVHLHGGTVTVESTVGRRASRRRRPGAPAW
jgi:signal transduction histidine kinase